VGGTGFQPVKFGILPNFVGGCGQRDELEFAEPFTSSSVSGWMPVPPNVYPSSALRFSFQNSG
jgi:hypothetical protein